MKVITNEEPSKQEKNPIKTKVIIICLLAAVIIAGLGILGYKTWQHDPETGGQSANTKGNGYKDPLELADDFVTYTYQGDTEAIFKLQPECFQARSIEDIQTTYALDENDYAGAISYLKVPLSEYMETLNAQHGQWTETHEVSKEIYVYTDDELKDLQQELKFEGVDENYIYEITQVAVADVWVSLEASNGSGGYHHTIHVPIYKHGNYWYLGQRVGETFLAMTEEENDPYGTLLDGFNMVGEWDQNGDRVIRNADGYQIFTEDETKREYYEDVYGNKCYYSSEGYEAGEIVEIVGPDGGEPLNEDTWEEWWNNYYKEQGFNIYPDHQHDEYGNIQYLDDNGNITETVGPDGGVALTEETYEAWCAEHGDDYDEKAEHAGEDFEESLDNLPENNQ